MPDMVQKKSYHVTISKYHIGILSTSQQFYAFLGFELDIG